VSEHPEMTTVALGAHVLDVLARPVEEIPEGQGSTLVEQIRVAPAGAAGGTAVTLAKLGARTFSAGAVGTDALGDLLLDELRRCGVDVTHLARREDVQTSATVLPIRPNGDRPALHVIGANGSITSDDIPWETIASADALHLGGPEFLGPDLAGEVLSYCGDHRVITSVDMLADGWPELLEMLAPIWPSVDHFLPNDDQALKLTGTGDLDDAAEELLDRGISNVGITCGADGSLVANLDGSQRVPAFTVEEVVDTSGCGDAFSAGYLRGLSLGHEPAEAARIGSAAASFVAGGLGSDAGEFDLDRVLELAETGPGAGSS
jgi:sugar/nucleoside kinase (ribokinase family)